MSMPQLPTSIQYYLYTNLISHRLLSELPQLKSVKTMGINVGDKNLQTLAASKTLKEVDINLCSGISEADLIYFVQHCTTIEILGYANMQQNMTDATLEAIANYGKRVKKLNISTCFKITDRGNEMENVFLILLGVQEMLKKMPQLEHITSDITGAKTLKNTPSM
jgi:hypothetical protein